MLSCQALAMLTFAICRRFWVAIGVPPLVLVSGITMHDAIYPVMLMGWSHTFGMFGLSLTLLAVGLIGSGFLRTGGRAGRPVRRRAHIHRRADDRVRRGRGDPQLARRPDPPSTSSRGFSRSVSSSLA